MGEIDLAEYIVAGRLEVLIPAMAKQESVTEPLKAADQMEWVCRMNNIKYHAEEIVLPELVYDWQTV